MDTPFRIGVWVDQKDLPETGGGFSYTERLVSAINEKTFGHSLEIYFVGRNLERDFKKKTINLPDADESYFVRKLLNFFHKFFKIELDHFFLPKENFAELLIANKIQLIFYPDPYVRLENFPYIISNWDLGHKTSFAFPEFSMNNRYELRNVDCDKNLNKAIFVCCESIAGKDELQKYLNINPERIKLLPIFPGKIVEFNIEEVKPEWIDDNPFYLYPAQFWPHKNHYNLILGFKALLQNSSFKNFTLILTGANKGNLPYIKQTIAHFNLAANIRITGFIKNEELKWLYTHAVGLVFPTFLGPTNMPLLEANALGCNVACSDLNGHRELLGDEAIYFDPKSPMAICDAMIQLHELERDHVKLKTYSINDIMVMLDEIFQESIPIRKTWGSFDKIS